MEASFVLQIMSLIPFGLVGPLQSQIEHSKQELTYYLWYAWARAQKGEVIGQHLTQEDRSKSQNAE